MRGEDDIDEDNQSFHDEDDQNYGDYDDPTCSEGHETETGVQFGNQNHRLKIDCGQMKQID